MPLGWAKPGFDFRLPDQMKFSVELKNENALNFLRRLGYAPEGADPKTGEWRFSRALRGARYPRFHVYLPPARNATHSVAGGPVQTNQKAFLNLHLDQKQPSYQGSSAHSGEYDGTLVEAEAKRISSAASSPRSSFGEAGR